MKVIVYYRTKPGEAALSEQALTVQRSAVAEWLATHTPRIVEEVVEKEGDNHSHYARLSEAATTSRIQNMTLLIASLAAIGRGHALDFPVAGARVDVADTQFGRVRPCPSRTPEGLSLYLSGPAGRTTSVYLCNRADLSLRNITLKKNGVALPLTVCTEDWMHDERPHSTHDLPANAAVLIDDYDPACDPAEYRIAYRSDDDVGSQHASATIAAGSPRGQFATFSTIADNTPTKVVVYYRTRPDEPHHSEQALAEQRAAVSQWSEDRTITRIAERTEAESDGFSRPALRAAIDACQQTGATLLIARTEAIGSGDPFEPRITSVAVAFAPDTPRARGSLRPCPGRAPDGLSLYFADLGVMRTTPVYLCNRSGQLLRDVAIRTSGITSKMTVAAELVRDAGETKTVSSPLTTTTATFAAGDLPANTAVLIGHFDPLFDGEMITGYEIIFGPDPAQRQRLRALIPTGGPTERFVPLGT